MCDRDWAGLLDLLANSLGDGSAAVEGANSHELCHEGKTEKAGGWFGWLDWISSSVRRVMAVYRPMEQM